MKTFNSQLFKDTASDDFLAMVKNTDIKVLYFGKYYAMAKINKPSGQEKSDNVTYSDLRFNKNELKQKLLRGYVEVKCGYGEDVEEIFYLVR